MQKPGEVTYCLFEKDWLNGMDRLDGRPTSWLASWEPSQIARNDTPVTIWLYLVAAAAPCTHRDSQKGGNGKAAAHDKQNSTQTHRKGKHK